MNNQTSTNNSSLTLTQLIQSWDDFSKKVLQLVYRLGLDKLELNSDHCALRVNDLEHAQQLQHEFEQIGQVISNNMINGRPILIIELNQALILGSQTIDCVELPYPSDKHYPTEGWEHIELVLPSSATNCQQLADELITKVPTLAAVINGETDIKIKMSSPKGAHERLANPTIAFKENGICVKVHLHHIKDIIASEQG